MSTKVSHQITFTDDELITIASALGDALTYLFDHSLTEEPAWIERYQQMEERIDQIRGES